MSYLAIGALSIVVIIALICAGVHVAIGLMSISLLGIWTLKGSLLVAPKALGLAASDAITGYEFGVVPLFVLVGMLISVLGMGRDTFRMAHDLFRGLQGGMGRATVAANAIFAAATGISRASAAVFTKVAMTEMMRVGYKKRFALGIVAGLSVLGMLIPPNLLMILLGVLTETSIGDLLKGGTVLGVLLAFVYGVVIYLMVKWIPQKVIDVKRESAQLSTNGSLEI